MKRFIYLTILMLSAGLQAQTSSNLWGNIKDEFGFAVVDADVSVGGTSVFTNEEGTFELDLNQGEYELVVSAFGFKNLIQTIKVIEGQKTELSLVLTEESQLETSTELKEVVLTAKASKEVEASLLGMQQKAGLMIESIGSQELQRKGVGDVAQAVTKVSGISKQEGSAVIYVRGLGDRYNSSMMNGLPIPSNDPELKNIDLSLFSTDILSRIAIDKVYNGTLYGDFAGGNINIETKKHTGKAFLNLGAQAKFNSNAISDTNFRLQSGISQWGFDKSQNPNTLTKYNFENSLNPHQTNDFGKGFSLSAGNKFKVGEQSNLSFYLSGNFSSEFNSIKDGFLKSGVNAQGIIQGKDFTDYKVFSYNTNSTGFLNLNLDVNPKNNLSFNSLLVNSSNQKLEEGMGYMRDNANEGGLQRRGTYTLNRLWVNQLLGEHEFSQRLNLNWALGLNKITSDMPDRFQNTLEWKSDLNQYVIANSSVSLNHRYFQELEEKEYLGRIALEYQLFQNDDMKYNGKLSFGYNGRQKNRDFNAMQYNLSPNRANQVADFNNLDAFFNQQNFANGEFSMTTFSGQSLKPQFYSAEQSIHAVFTQFEYKFANRLLAIIALRGENISQTVEWNTSLDPMGADNTIEDFKILPALSLKYEINPKQNLRLGASQTYTLPQFKERALFMYEDLGETVYGWPTTYASTDYNFDLKWEFFPNSGELISLTGFGKYIENPINKFTVASSTNDVSFANTGDWAYVVGAELEVRKSIFKSENLNPVQLTAGANLSYALTNQELDNEKVFNETLLSNGSRLNANFNKEEDAFQGASDLLVNADLSLRKEWQNGGSVLMSLVYNHFSDRIYAIGTDGRGNIVEKGRGILDFVLRSELNKNLSFDVKVQNILNSAYSRVQENPTQEIEVLHYKSGVNFGLGINYQF